MIRYCDNGPFNDRVCPGHWFDANVVEGIRAFRGQFGFFRIGALRKYAGVLRSVVVTGKPVNLVLGSNATDPLTIQDVRELVALLSGRTDSHLTIVALGNALFHPKVAHVLKEDRTAAAMVGSANFTELALGVHVEAWIELTSDPALDATLNDIVAAIDAWHACRDAGVYQVRSERDAVALLEQGILVEEATRQQRQAAGRRSRDRASGRGSRHVRWRAPARAPRLVVESEADVHTAETQSEPETGGPREIRLRWTKRLSASDVNKNARNIRNLLSLTKAGLIDDLDYFRYVFFADARWQAISIGDHPAEVAEVRFEVKLPSTPGRAYTLKVVHAPHRESGQHNYHTSIRWGPLSSVLRGRPRKGYTGHWCVIERYSTGEYGLTIARKKPAEPRIG